jgi:hypothetical protein
MSATTHQAFNASNDAGLSPLQPPETHQEAQGGHAEGHMTGRDVARVLAMPVDAPGRPRGLGLTPFQYLPLFAKVAIERLNSAEHLRTAAQLDDLLQAYAKTYGRTVDLETCAAVHRICARRFVCFVAFPGTAQ